MPSIEKGDITEAGVVVLTVACDGHMGAGVNLRMRERYPRWFETYREDCTAGHLVVGVPVLYHVGINRWIVAVPVKRAAREPANLLAMRNALADVTSLVAQTNQTAIAIDIGGLGVADLGVDEIQAALMVDASKLREIAWYAEPVRVLCEPSQIQRKYDPVRLKHRGESNPLRRIA